MSILYQNTLPTPTPNAEFTRRLYSVHMALPRAHGALEDPTALPQLYHFVLSNTLCKRQATAFILNMLKTNAATWLCWRLHSVHLGDLHFFFERCRNAVRTPLWCDITQL